MTIDSESLVKLRGVIDRLEMDIEFERFRIECFDQRVLARLWWKGYLYGSGSHIQWDYMKDSPRLSYNFGKLDDEALCNEALDCLGWYLTTKTPAERTAWTEGFLDGAMSGRKRIHAG